jgi:regulator of sirC expression with transglutaminase-like and TPR domain
MNDAADQTLEAFRAAISGPDEEIDLARAALVVARIHYPDLDIEPFLDSLNALAAKVRARFDPEGPVLAQINALSGVLLRDLGLAGAAENYYDPRNSFLNDVLERKIGIPVSLSIAYMSVGARAGIALGGTAIPRHFLVRVLGESPPLFIDVYGKGRIMDLETCKQAVRRMFRGRIELHPEMFQIVSNAAIITRLLMNLKMIHLNRKQYASVIPILDRMILVDPADTALLRERGIVRYQLGQPELARRDLERYLAAARNPDDAHDIRALLRKIGR